MAPLTVHSVRFYNVSPMAIHALCPAPDNRRVALSRADNAIEIWDVHHRPVLQKWIPGNDESSVESLAWAGDRLFSAGLHGLVLEHDLTTLTTKQQFAVTSGPAWCMEYNKNHRALAVGTEEGYVCLFKVTSEGLDYWKTLDKQEGRILCLNWHSSGKFIVTGSPDTLRVWDVKTGSPTVRMTTGRVERNRETIVWSVAMAEDLTIVSGDSRGKTCFWNGKTGTLIDSYQTHKADVLAVAMHKKNNLALSSGVDPWIMHFQPVLRNDQRTKWVKSVHRWVHTHDVRALSFTPGKILSAGLDATLAVNDTNAKSAVRYMPKPQGQFAAVSRKAKLLLLRYSKYIELWKLGETEEDIEAMRTGSYAPLSKEPVKVLTLKTKDEEMIRSCHVSPDGSWVAYATPTRMRVYNLDGVRGAHPGIHRATLEAEDIQISHHLRFTSESKLVSVTESGDLQLFHLEAQTAKLIETIAGVELGMKGAVSLVEVKEGYNYCILADYYGNISTFDVKQKKVIAKAPLYKAAPAVALSISTNGENIVIAYSDNHVVEFNLQSGRYTKFSNSLRLPSEFKKKKHATNGIVQLTSRDRDLLVLYDDVRVCSIDRNDLFEKPANKVLKQSRQKKDSEEVAADGDDNKEPETKIKFTKKYESLLFMAALDEDSTLLALEVRPTSIEDQLPPSLKQKKFGAM